jgi:4-hydroxythreonine-4-phosphate dehydrogenase
MTPAAMRLAVTLGDPRGIGPEVTAAVVRSAAIPLVVVGPTGTAADPDEVVGRWDGGTAAEAGRLAGLAIERAVAMALAGEVGGIVTAPIDKTAMAAAGYPHPGHTEMLQALTAAPEVAMLMVAERTRLGGALRVVLATIHIPLAAVTNALTRERVVGQARLAAAALRERWGFAAPRLALCALNPHASDGGLFGDEERRVLEPAVLQLQQEGIDIAGPIPADTVFTRALGGEFEAVIAPYHDVGMAAFKTASFGTGVNVTLGLPFIRTSPDHGTALDIAGRGTASPTSMAEAVRLATRLLRGPQPATLP